MSAADSTEAVARGLVACWVDLDAAAVDGFASWADDYLDRQQKADGVVSATRYSRASGEPEAMLLFEVDGQAAADALLSADDAPDDEGAAAAWRNAARGYYALQAASAGAEVPDALARTPTLFVVRVLPSDDWIAPLREWLQEEHFRIQPQMPGVRWCRGYEPADERSFLNLWAVDRPDVIDSPEWIEVRGTPWYERVRPAFGSGAMHRGIYQPHPGPTGGTS